MNEQKINIQLNGTQMRIDNQMSLYHLVEELNLNKMGNIALICNEEVIPQHQWNDTFCHHGDKMVFFTLVAGG